MHQDSRRFVWRVLFVHALALAGVIAIVLFAAWHVNQSIRVQAKDQARQQQELLVKQTAVGVENYYSSITKVLDLLRPIEDAENEASTTQPESAASTQPGETAERASTRSPLLERPAVTALRNLVGDALWEQLKDRCSLLMLVDRSTMQIVRAHGGAPGPTADRVLEEEGGWILGAQAPVVSSFKIYDEVGGHLVAVPLRGPRRALIIAFVPTSRVEQALFSDVRRRATLGAMLIDSERTIVAADDGGLIGHAATRDLPSEAIRTRLDKVIEDALPISMIDQTAPTKTVPAQTSLTTFQPARVLGQNWWIVVTSSLSEIETGVDDIFTEAGRWAIFLVVSMTAILVSTSVQLIRARMRMERVQHSMVQKELSEARHIQLAWLPSRTLALPSIDIAAVNQPARHISGDFYNWFVLSDGRVAVIIGDVTGHGLSAAFLMATTQLLVRTTMTRLADPAKCMEEVNHQLCGQMFNGQFVTMLIMAIDIERGEIEIASAGHAPPLVSDGTAGYRELPAESQLAMGIENDMTYTSERFNVAPDSSLLLYTDGAVEAESATGARYSIEDLQRALNHRFMTAQQLLDGTIDAVNRFRGEEELKDDLTLVAIQLQRVNSPRKPTPISMK